MAKSYYIHGVGTALISYFEKDENGDCIGQVTETSDSICVKKSPVFNSEATSSTESVYSDAFERADAFGSRPPIHH